MTEPEAKLTTDDRVSALQTDLVRQILAWLDRTEVPVGTPLREVALANTFGVSRTPVRSALLMLEKLGYVSSSPRRGFVLAKPVDAGQALDDDALPRSALEELQETVIADRASGRLPAEVSEAELIARYGQSRGVIRRVMMRLSDDGIAQRLSGHGWGFAEALDSMAAIRDSYHFRMVIECGAMREPGFRPDPVELRRLREAHVAAVEGMAKLDSRAWFAINSRFHEAIATWSGNRFFVEASRRQTALRRLSEYRAFPNIAREGVERSSAEHLAILDAIAAGDYAWGATLLQRHLEINLREYVAKYQDTGEAGLIRRG